MGCEANECHKKQFISNFTFSIVFADFVVNFSYRLGIGDQFENWQTEESNRQRGSEVKVFLAPQVL